MTDVERSQSGMQPYSDVVYVFEPNDRSLPDLGGYLREVWSRRRFIVAMADAELKGRRTSTFLGELWAIIDPLFMAALYWLLITILRGNGGGDTAQERIAIMVGCIFLFSALSNTITEGGQSILRSKALMLNSTFPRAVLPLSAVYKHLRSFVPCIPVYLLIHVALGQPWGLGLFVLPLLFALQIVMSLGFALLFATLTVYVRDTTNLLGYAMRVLFFATPILYPVSTMSGKLQTILQIGPFYGLFASYQAVITGGVPHVRHVLEAAAWAGFAIVIGYRTFVRHEREFALRL